MNALAIFQKTAINLKAEMVTAIISTFLDCARECRNPFAKVIGLNKWHEFRRAD
jgi:hypothetical protein